MKSKLSNVFLTHVPNNFFTGILKRYCLQFLLTNKKIKIKIFLINFWVLWSFLNACGGHSDYFFSFIANILRQKLMLVNKKNRDLLLIFCNKLSKSSKNFVFFNFYYAFILFKMLLSTFIMVKFKDCCHGNELIDLYQNCVELT